MKPFGVCAGRFDTPAEIVNLRRVDGTPYLVAGIVGLLAVLSIGHLVVTSARRHRFDLAVLRAFGATRGWLGGVVHWQATVIAALAVVLAVPLGVAVGTALYGPYAETDRCPSRRRHPCWLAGHGGGRPARGHQRGGGPPGPDGEPTEHRAAARPGGRRRRVRLSGPARPITLESDGPGPRAQFIVSARATAAAASTRPLP